MLLFHLVVSFMMVAVIVLVQVLIYPQFFQVSSSHLMSYASFHVSHISYVVVPLMLLELGSLIWLWRFAEYRSFWLVMTTVCLAGIWLYTFLVMVPLHDRLVAGDASVIEALVRLNWVRVVLWVVKALLALGFFMVVMAPSRYQDQIRLISIETPISKPNGAYRDVLFETDAESVLELLEREKVAYRVVSAEGDELRLILFTPWLRFPDVVVIRFGDGRTLFRSQSLLGYSDLGANAQRIEWLVSALHRLP